MASAMHEPMLDRGLSSCIVINGAGVGMAVRALVPLDSDMRARPGVRMAAVGHWQRLSDHVLAIEWVYRSVSFPVEDDGWDSPLASGQPAGLTHSQAGNHDIILAHHRERRG